MANHPRREIIDGTSFVIRDSRLISCIVSEILQFLDFGNLAWKCLLMPILGGFLRVHKAVRARRWVEKTRTVQDGTGKVTKWLYFTYLGRIPHWSNLHQKLFSRWRSRRNYMCQASKWNFQGLRFYMGRIFHFPIDFWMGLTQQCSANCAACDRYLWHHFTLTTLHTNSESTTAMSYFRRYCSRSE